MTDQTWTVYLARPLDQAAAQGVAWDIVRSLLEEAGAQVYDPGSWTGPPNGMPFAQQVHDAALDWADGVFACLPDGQASVGVPMEVERAVGLSKPVVVLGGNIVAKSPVLAARGVPVFLNPDQAVNNLKAAVLGDHPELDETIRVFLGLVDLEVRQALIKHPRSDDPEWTTLDRWFSIWIEEVIEAVQAWNDRKDPNEIREELVQVAAMSLQLWRATLAG